MSRLRSRPTDATGTRFPSRTRSLLPLVAALLLFAACRSTPPDIVLVTIDTLRADQLGLYGATGDPTPNIDRLGEDGTVFLHASTPMPETRPAHFALMTGLYPRDLGAVSNATRLPETADTLAEALGHRGYFTAAATGSALLEADSGIAQGFAWFDPPHKELWRPAPQVVAAVARGLAAAGKDRPLFLWVHLFDPHMPYNAHGPVAKGAIAEVTWPLVLEQAARHGGDLPAPVLRRAEQLYRQEVTYADAQVGRLVELLRRRGHWQDTLFALAADHGECFEKGIYFEHSNCLYEGAIHIPLLLRFPGKVARGQREQRPVELLDVAPTLFRLAGLGSFPAHSGRDLFSSAQAPPPVFLEHPFYPASDLRERQRRLSILRSVAGQPSRPITASHEQLGVRSAAMKLLQLSSGAELYDLQHDPGETTNLLSRRPNLVRRLHRLIVAWRRQHPLHVPPRGDIDPELERKLRDLGYL